MEGAFVIAIIVAFGLIILFLGTRLEEKDREIDDLRIENLNLKKQLSDVELELYKRDSYISEDC